MKYASKLALAALFALCNWAFAEPDVQEAVPPVEAVPQQEPAKDSVVKDSVFKHRWLLNVGYIGSYYDGLEASAVVEAIKPFKYLETNYIFRYGPGLGMILGDDFFYHIFFNAHLGLQKSDFEYFLNNRLGTNVFCDNSLFCTWFYEPSIGIQYNNLNLSLGYNISINETAKPEKSVAVRLGYRFETVPGKEQEPEPKIEDKVSEAPKEEKKEEKKSTRFFRPGIEVNYSFWRSSVDYFDNSSPNIGLGLGLFLRIGPDGFYFTTGVYAKGETFERHETADLEFFNIKASLPLMDLYYEKGFIEVPLLLSFGSGQIRFTFGALLDFYSDSHLEIKVLDEKVLSAKVTESIEEQFNNNPDGDIYFTVGLDFDIVRHWGLGIKFLVWGSSFGEEKPLIEPARCQTRVSTYFVF